MDGSSELERRMIGEAPGLHIKTDENGKTVIRGYAAVFDSESQDLGGFVEVIDRGAFDEVMRKNPDVFGRFNHERLLGRTTSGTMRLKIDERGLLYEIDPPRSAADVVEWIERGDVRGSSFAFRVSGKNERWEKNARGQTLRRIVRFDSLHDAGPVETPAYLATETYVSKRALKAAQWTPVGDDETSAEVPEVQGSVTPDEQRADSPVVETSAEPAAAEAPQPEERADVSMKPTAGMASAARRGLKLHEEGKSGDGLKPETVARANKLAKRDEMNEDWIREMNAWFARHDSASKSPGWDTPGKEKPGFVAWLLWGGTAARNWSARKVKELEGERDLPAIDEERDFDDEPVVDATPAPADTTDYVGKAASLKSLLLSTHLHGK